MRIWAALLILGSVGISGRALAQPASGECFPACRPGFLCHQGQCVSACNPPCGPGTLCSPQAECVSACNPACGPGTLCSPQGECVSACNPPCAAGQTCAANGTCSGPPPGQGPPGGAPPPYGGGPAQGGPPPGGGYGYGPPTQQGYGPPAQGGYGGQGPAPGVMMGPSGGGDPGWANTAGILGVVTAVVVGAMTAGIVAAEDPDVGLPVGIAATVVGGIMIPVVAMGAGSARTNPSIEGSSGLRLAGWIAYGFAMADALVLIGLGVAEVEVDVGIVATVGILGVLSSIGMIIDAFASASQAEEAGGGYVEGPALEPFLSLTSADDLDDGFVLGLRGAL